MPNYANLIPVNSRQFKDINVRRLVSFLTLLVIFSMPNASTQFNQTNQEYMQRGKGGAASTIDHYATEAAINIIKIGGNAVDAAVAAAAVINVSNPFSAGIGGGGFMLIYLADEDRVVTIDAREMAPLVVTPEMFLDDSGDAIPTTERVSSGLAVGVPGTLAGWDEALGRYGTLGLDVVLRPAIRLAEEGFPVDEDFAAQIAGQKERFNAFTSTAQLFLPDGAVPQIGSTFRNPDLAETLRQVADAGIEAFYKGEIAHDIVEAVQDPPVIDDPPFKVRGQEMTLSDLDTYNVVLRDPIVTKYRDFKIYGMGPPSSGGLTVSLILNMLEGNDLGSLPRPVALHEMIEAMKLAFADRDAYTGDSDFVNVPVEGLQSQDYADERAELITEEAASEVAPGDPFAHQDDLSPPLLPPEEDDEGQSTTHIVTMDAEGNAVSFTTTIGRTGGSGIVVPGRGFILNSTLNAFDKVPGGPNSGEPRKRSRSSMAPTIITREGKLYLAIGSPGGATIITTVAQVLLNVLEFWMALPEAIDAPRFSNRGGSSTNFEFNVLPSEELLQMLEGYGQSLQKTKELGAVTGILVLGDGEIVAAAEKVRRGGGSAQVVNPQ